MTACALLNENPNPSEDDIKVALKDTYCRCTGYTSVIRTIKSAASVVCSEALIQPSLPDKNPEDLKVGGEISPINTTPAIASTTGVRVYNLPVDQDALLRAIKSGQREVRAAWQDIK